MKKFIFFLKMFVKKEIINKLKYFLYKFVSWKPWNIAFVSAIAIISIVSVVDFRPHVDNDFFFSTSSKQFESEQKIAEMFPLHSQIIISAKGDIQSEKYLRKLEQLTKQLKGLDYVTGVKSLTDGPDDVADALKSPLWKRLLISDDNKSSNVIVFLMDKPAEEIVSRIEQIIKLIPQEGFKLEVAGIPYMVELIRRNLVHDLVVFSTLALLIFICVILLIFKSFKILAGTLTSCINACILTLVISQLLKVKIGILTANLSTIVFVLTLSHIIFITNNWRREISLGTDPSVAVSKSIKLTFEGSLWCMITTLLGFISLVFVQAKPLRELGVSGSIGTLVSAAIAYTIYPLFLKTISVVKQKSVDLVMKKELFVGNYVWATVTIAFITGFCLTGLQDINTDPSLLSYFKKGSPLRQGLEYIDRNGGSSPLNLIIKDADERKLTTSQAYRRLWQFQEELEEDPSIGSVVSLPVLLAEGKRAPLAFFVSLEGILRIMDDPKYNRITKSFVTDDRKRAHFVLRMKENGRDLPRADIINRFKTLANKYGFKVDLAGGIYILQGELARLVAVSLLGGLSKLVLLFMGVAYIVSRCYKITLAMVGCLSVIPIIMLGILGHLNIPLDIISSPAANVAIAMGIDSMIHMVIVMRRSLAKSDNEGFWQAWQDARNQLWRPVLSSMAILCAGFGIFSFSMFPPTQRFGITVMLGTILAAPVALFVLPSVVGPWFYRIKEKEPTL